MPKRTIQQQLQAASFRPAGFDYLRLALCSAVLLWHTVVITHGFDYQNAALHAKPLHVAVSMIVPMFFAVSGFLVASSLDRTRTIGGFLMLRAIRIFPALILLTLFSALLLGPLATRYGASQYWSDPLLLKFFLNCVVMVQNKLPGVFMDHPLPGVLNGQLWSLPFEVRCYLGLTLLSVTGLLRNRWLFLGSVAALQALLLGRAIFGAPIDETTFPASILYVCFLAATVLFRFRDKIPCSAVLAVASAGACILLLCIPHGSYALPFPVAYLTVWLGLTQPRRLWIVSSGDYSYGIFLYSFALQQLAWHLMPFARTWYGNALIAWPIAFATAFISWHCVEKRVLKLRKSLHSFEGHWISTRRRFAPQWMHAHLDRATLVDQLPER